MAPDFVSTERLRPRNASDASAQSVPLSILDAGCARFSPTGAIWIFDDFSPSTEDQLLKNLKTAFITALDKFPHFAGQLHWAPWQQNGDHTTRFNRAMVTFGSETNPGVEWTVARLSRKAEDLAPDAASRASGDQVWLGKEFPQNELLASKTQLALGDLKTFKDLPAMLVQVTILEGGGFTVAAKMAHPLADASTFVLFVRHWAEASRALHTASSTSELEAPVFDPQSLDARASGDIDSPKPDLDLIQKSTELPLHRYDWWATDAEGHPPFMTPVTENNKPTNPVLLKEAMEASGRVPPWTTWDLLRPVSHAVIHFTQEQVEQLRSRVSESTPRPSRLDVVLAHIWGAINRARGLGESDEEVFLNLTMGVRGRVEPPLEDSFVGSPLIMAHVQATGREAAADHETSTKTLASRIRQCVNKFTPQAMGAILHRAAYEVSPQRFWQAFLGRHHILVTSWLRLGMNDIDFLGRADAAPRYCHPIMPLVDGCLLGVDGGGGMELSLYLEDEAMQRLLKDPGLFP